jgi:hypothetical protein
VTAPGAAAYVLDVVLSLVALFALVVTVRDKIRDRRK